MSFIISDESGTSGATHARDAWGWPRQERPSESVQTFPVQTFPVRDLGGSTSPWAWQQVQGLTA